MANYQEISQNQTCPSCETREAGGSGVSETAPAPCSPAAGTGAPRSNTAPANCKIPAPNTHILRSGIDSLYVSYPGKLPPSTAANLDQLKEQAKSPDPEVRASAFKVINDHQFEVRDRGKGRFPYVLVDNWFHIQVAGEAAAQLPLAYVQMSSELLTCAGWEPALDDLTATVSKIGRSDRAPTISRVDLCVDFTTETDIAAQPLDAWVARARQLGCYYGDNRLTGYSFGLGGDVAARFYDKTEEIRKSRKHYFEHLWLDQGWDGEATVWRLEFQFKRPVLKELGIETQGELRAKLAALWRYGTESWLRLTVPNPSDETRSRWPNHPFWDDLAGADWGNLTSESLSRVKQTRAPDDHFLFVNGISGITSYMAREGISDFYDGLSGFIREAVAYHRRVGYASGTDLQRYAWVKTSEKSRRYNTPLSSPKPDSDGSTEVGE